MNLKENLTLPKERFYIQHNKFNYFSNDYSENTVMCVSEENSAIFKFFLENITILKKILPSLLITTKFFEKCASVVRNFGLHFQFSSAIFRFFRDISAKKCLFEENDRNQLVLIDKHDSNMIL